MKFNYIQFNNGSVINLSAVSSVGTICTGDYENEYYIVTMNNGREYHIENIYADIFPLYTPRDKFIRVLTEGESVYETYTP